MPIGPVGQGNLYSGALAEVNAQVARMRNLGQVGNLIRTLPTRAAAAEATATELATGARFGLPGLLTVGASMLAQPAAFGLASWLRSPQGINTKDRLRQGDVLGAFTAATGIGRRPETLRAYNPPGFTPGAPVSTKDLLQTASQVGNITGRQPFTPAGGSPQERAYREAGINAAQQAASNPLFQKYRVADLTKQYNEAKTPEERTNIGMQIWAQTNPQLAAKLKQGQAGYAEAHSAPGMSNAGGYTLPSLPLSSSSFTAATQMQSPVTLEQNFGAPFPGVGMVSANPAAFKPQPGQVPYATKLDMQQTFGGPGTFDPAALNITQDQRRALINQYAQGLVNKPFPPAAK